MAVPLLCSPLARSKLQLPLVSTCRVHSYKVGTRTSLPSAGLRMSVAEEMVEGTLTGVGDRPVAGHRAPVVSATSARENSPAALSTSTRRDTWKRDGSARTKQDSEQPKSRAPGQRRTNFGPTQEQQSEGNLKSQSPRSRSRSLPSSLTRKKEQPPSEPVAFAGSFPKHPHVAVLGGGMSGLMCALTLARELGIRSTVFDTGRHGTGGRMGTREIDVASPQHKDGGSTGSNEGSTGSDKGSKVSNEGSTGSDKGSKVRKEGGQGHKAKGVFVFDHAAQLFTVSGASARFALHVSEWLRRGWVKEWQGCVGYLSPGGRFTPLPKPEPGAAFPWATSQGLNPGSSQAEGGGAREVYHQRKAQENLVQRGHSEAKGAVEGLMGSGSLPGVGDKGQGREDEVRIHRALRPGAKFDQEQGRASDSHIHEALRPGAKFCGVQGMRHLSEALAAEAVSTGLVTIARPIWITRMSYCSNENGEGEEKWRLVDEHGKHRGDFDFVVIAHNGKCANRLLAPAGVPQVNAQMKRLQLSAIWCSMVTFETPLPVPFGRPLPETNEAPLPAPSEGSRTGTKGLSSELLQHQGNGGVSEGRMEGAFVSGVPAVSWMGNNTAKLSQRQAGRLADDAASASGHECWTIFSTGEYGRRNKVPQERVPAHVADRVKGEMLEGVCTALGISREDLPRVVYHRVQLWGAALPLNAPGVPFICDAPARVAMCGDWLMSPSLEAAALSGMTLADEIGKFAREGKVLGHDSSVGLRKELVLVPGAQDIGTFP